VVRLTHRTTAEGVEARSGERGFIYDSHIIHIIHGKSCSWVQKCDAMIWVGCLLHRLVRIQG
jgi:hypothetical protein